MSLSSLAPRAWSRAWGGGLLAGLALLAGCPIDNKSSRDTSQVAATVNGDELSIHQVRSALTSHPKFAGLGPQAAQAVLDMLVEQELAAQAARKSGLDKSPDVIQALEVAKREVLAKAYEDQVTGKLTPPDTETIDRYYDLHPELFGRRKRYTLLETTVRGPTAALAPIMEKVEQGAVSDDIRPLLSATRLPIGSRTFTFWAEDLPMEILPRLVYLKEGQSIGVMQDQGLVVLTLLQAEEHTLSRPLALESIRMALMAQARREALQAAIGNLRKQSKLVFNPPFKASPAAAASAPASSATEASAPGASAAH